jgi:large subunit ribosomal protein L2
MAIVTRKPTNSSLRFQSFMSSDDITKKSPEKSLVKGMRKQGGRNSYGRITMRHQGGGAPRKYRMIDFNRMERDIEGKVAAIEYDPNRNVRIALVVFKNGVKAYILKPQGLEVGHTIIAGTTVDAKVGNCSPLRNIPVGFNVHNIEMTPGSGGKLVRSAGCFAQIVSKDGVHVTLKMPSGEIRMVAIDCWATVGELGNAEYKNISWGKAGRTRQRGIRPTVRGMAMNPVDHPHGGGEGRSKSGSHPMTPWGKGCKGTRTRTRKNALILKRRKSRKEK